MTSDLLKKTTLKNVSYRITGKDGLCILVNIDRCCDVKAADQHALNEAMAYAKRFPSVKLYKKVGTEETVIYDAAATKQAYERLVISRRIFIPLCRLA